MVVTRSAGSVRESPESGVCAVQREGWWDICMGRRCNHAEAIVREPLASLLFRLTQLYRRRLGKMSARWDYGLPAGNPVVRSAHLTTGHWLRLVAGWTTRWLDFSWKRGALTLRSDRCKAPKRTGDHHCCCCMHCRADGRGDQAGKPHQRMLFTLLGAPRLAEAPRLGTGLGPFMVRIPGPTWS